MAMMSIRAYDRHRRVSHVAVLKALRTGRIRRTSDGLIDSDEPDRDWAARRDPRRALSTRLQNFAHVSRKRLLGARLRSEPRP
jgi:hypothetical protein